MKTEIKNAEINMTTTSKNTALHQDPKIIELPINEIHIDPILSRLFKIEPKVQNTIAVDIKANGYDKGSPIDVFKNGDKYTVVDGHTRLGACVEAGISTITAVVRPFANIEDAVTHSYKTQIHRRNLDGAALVAFAEVMAAHTQTKKELRENIVATTGVKKSKADNLAKIAADPEVAKEVATNKISITGGAKKASANQKAAKKQKATEEKKKPLDDIKLPWAAYSWLVIGEKGLSKEDLHAPSNTPPRKGPPTIASDNVVIQGDLLGKNVSEVDRARVMDQVEFCCDKNFITITGNMDALASLKEGPSNLWVAVKVTTQKELDLAEVALGSAQFPNKAMFIDLGNEPLKLGDTKVAGWLILNLAKDTSQARLTVEKLLHQARTLGMSVMFDGFTICPQELPEALIKPKPAVKSVNPEPEQIAA